MLQRVKCQGIMTLFKKSDEPQLIMLLSKNIHPILPHLNILSESPTSPSSSGPRAFPLVLWQLSNTGEMQLSVNIHNKLSIRFFLCQQVFGADVRFKNGTQQRVSSCKKRLYSFKQLSFILEINYFYFVASFKM